MCIRDRWISFLNNITERMNKTMIKELEMLKQKERELCHPSTCQAQPSCRLPPSEMCVRYAKKRRCVRQEPYCLNLVRNCTSARRECLRMEEVCVTKQTDDFGNSFCLKTRRICTEHIETCLKWEYVCLGEQILTCTEFDMFEDKNVCDKWDISCVEDQVIDPTCLHDCQNRFVIYEKYSENYNVSAENFAKLSRRLEGITAMAEALDKDTLFKFEKIFIDIELVARLNPKNLPVEIVFLTGAGNTHTMTVSLDFSTLESNVKKLFRLMVHNLWAYAYQFDEILLEKEEDILKYYQIKLK
eukprot:TRINITY_DN1588_c0_g2_i3.p1 TRINITY_DN1588_c0_g2~~TRINITY_DN1588_c0_g2_i3.p1  ORF type:complete len:320 (+),score=77.59 TRINITY_DN1588_c0_g2_i3:62-961(+)